MAAACFENGYTRYVYRLCCCWREEGSKRSTRMNSARPLSRPELCSEVKCAFILCHALPPVKPSASLGSPRSAFSRFSFARTELAHRFAQSYSRGFKLELKPLIDQLMGRKWICNNLAFKSEPSVRQSNNIKMSTWALETCDVHFSLFDKLKDKLVDQKKSFTDNKCYLQP